MVDSFMMFLSAYVGQAVGYFAVVGLVFLLTWRWGAARLAARRIRTRGRPFDAAQLRHEVGYTLIVLAVGTAQALGVYALQSAGWARVTDEIDLGSVGVGVGLMVFNDLWFYGVHRMLHTPWLFRHVHAVHHRSVDVNPFTSYAFHAVESVLVTGWLIPFVMLVPLSTPVLMAVQVAGLSNNVMAHLGYELLPAWWVRAPVLRWSNSATFHSLHHARFNGNYGLFSRVWDRWFGTELDGYEAAFSAAHAEAPASGGGVD